MRFVAGLTKFERMRKEAVKKVLVVNVKWSEENCCEYLDDYSLELLYECQNMSSLDKENTYSTVELMWFHDAHCWLNLGYCIANSNCAWDLTLDNSFGKEMLVLGLQDCKTQPALHYQEYILGIIQ